MLAKELSTLLAQRCEDVVRELLPNGEKKSGEWCIGSVGGEKGDSMKVRLAGAKVGVWADFATGESGDLLDLWALIKHQTISQAMNDICEYFNILPKKHELKGKQKSFVKPPVRAVETIKKESAAYVYLAQRRCLQDDTIRLYGIPNSDSELIFNYIRDKELIFVKTLKIERKDGKKDIHVSANCEPCLFGWNMIPKNARKVVICEGEIDAMSFFEYGIPALSVPFGGGRGDKQRWLDYEIDNLNRFDEIFICMDNDDAGIEGAREIIGRLGAHRCRVIQLPMKDANECLVNGISTEDIKYFIDNAKTFDPEELVFHDGFTDLTYEFMNPKPGSFEGYTLGWSYFDESILFRPSGLTMWTGYNGHGKTMFLSQVMLNMIKQGARICIASLELYPTELCARMYIQAAAMEHPSRGFMGAIDQWIDGKLMLFNLVGTAKIDRMLEVFLYARRRYGVDVFIVDSLTTLNIAEDDYNGQKELTERLRDFKLQYNCHIHLVAHPRKPRDENEIPGKYDIRGGGAISDLADNCFSIWRNKKKESIARKEARGHILGASEAEVLNQPDAYLRCDKNRHGRGKFKEGLFPFWFDEQSNQYLNKPEIKPKSYVEYSCLDND